jgi:pyruvate/2-oxoglutarate dehydrogenase complex dihydrolipoamide dehydrogenase (E3) component
MAATLVDRLLVSIGVQPVTEGLGLEEAGIVRDPRDFGPGCNRLCNTQPVS